MSKGIIKGICLHLLVLLAACGGGGSNSGGGSAPAPIPIPVIDRTGSYTGTQSWTLTGNGQSTMDVVEYSMTVTGSQVTITQFAEPDPVGPIDANGNFRVFAPGTFSLDDGTRCEAELAWDGNVGDGVASGSVVGTLTCIGIAIELSGTWEASRTGAAKQSSSNGIQTLTRLTNELF